MLGIHGPSVTGSYSSRSLLSCAEDAMADTDFTVATLELMLFFQQPIQQHMLTLNLSQHPIISRGNPGNLYLSSSPRTL